MRNASFKLVLCYTMTNTQLKYYSLHDTTLTSTQPQAHVTSGVILKKLCTFVVVVNVGPHMTVQNYCVDYNQQ